MEESILNSIKKLIGGFGPDDTSFDTDLIMSINTVLMVIMQEWYGMDHAFIIEDASATWSDFLGENTTDYEAVKTLVYLKVRMLFDPPQGQALMQAINDQIKDLEWRLYVWKDNERIDDGK